MKCAKLGCDRIAMFQALFQIYPLGYPEHNEPIEALVDLVVCTECATPENGVELLNANGPGRKKIEQSFHNQGFVPPDWDRSVCKWIPLELEIVDGGKMSSGMSVNEAINKARLWWDTQGGRHQMSKQLNVEGNVEEVGRKFTPTTGKSAAILIQGEKRAVIQSGILKGLEWDRLNKREQLQITKAWHQEHVLSPLQGMTNDLKAKH